jgi:hypothetical protein
MMTEMHLSEKRKVTGSMEAKREQIVSLEEALIGVKDKREEAFLLLNAIPEIYLPDIVEYFRILLGFKKIDKQTRS